MDNSLSPEQFLWRFGAGCVDALEHKISKGYIDHLRSCVKDGRAPSDDVIRRVFRRPFEILGKNCTLEDMQHYWRVAHKDPSEQTPVYEAQIAPYYGSIYPREDRLGLWWETWFYNKQAETFEHRVLHNCHRYENLKPGDFVLIHGNVIAEPAGKEHS